MRSLDLFSGIGGITYALRGLGIHPVAYCEISPSATDFLKGLMRRSLLPSAPIAGDVRKLSPQNLGKIDIIVGGFPCFPAGTLVVTRRGYVPIEALLIDDEVLSHTGTYRRIVNLQKKLLPAQSPMVSLIVGGHPRAVRCTVEHPFYSRARIESSGVYAKPTWTSAKDLNTGDLVGMPIDTRSDVPSFDVTRVVNQHVTRVDTTTLITPDQWYLLGYFVGDGWCQNTRKSDGRMQYRVCFAVSHRDEPEVTPRLLRVMHLTRADGFEGKVVKYVAQNQLWWTILNTFGKYAHGKLLPDWVHAAPAHLLEHFIEGYLKADGNASTTKAGTHKCRIGTISADLAFGIQRILLKTGQVYCVSQTRRPPTTTICGRTVNQCTTAYEISGIKGRIRQTARDGFIQGSYAWFPIRKVNTQLTDTGQFVYNMEVAIDNSYVVENMGVHNCVGFSSAGKREGIEQHESALFKEMMRLTKALQPPFVFMENVAAIVASPTGLSLVVRTLHKLGYDAQWLTVRGKDVGAPQRRDRWFCLAIKRSVSTQQLKQQKVRPFDWTKEPVARMLPGKGTSEMDRNVYSAFGNGVIPDCVRAAFCLLWQGIPHECDTRTLFAQPTLTLKRAQPRTPGKAAQEPPACGCSANGVIYACKRPKYKNPTAFKGLVLMPYAYKERHLVTRELTSKRIRGGYTLDCWATPRRNLGTSHVLTNRSSRDLGTQMRFEARTPESVRSGRPNGAWVQWLMGYPARYIT